VTRSGFIVGKRYRLDKRIAAGGVGQVWRATDLLLERPVAVKVLRPEYADHPDTLDRFRKEARNAGLLTHPHVAQVFDYGPGGAGCPPYLVMEFVDGPSLADVLAANPVAPAVALDVVAQTAAGLSAAHRAGLVHRDVKPGNILLGPGGQVKVTDFGIAHAAGQAPVTRPGLVMGTAQYLSPERIAGGSGTPASDLYALGIVLHECLTGMPPFQGTSAEVMAAHLYLPLPPLPASVPVEVDALVGRLTAKDPARRISDAGELADLAARLRDAQAPGHVAGGNLAELAAGTAPGAALGPGYVADEWVVPARMTSSTTAILREDPATRNRRRRAAALAVGAAVVTGIALVALLVSGALRDAPTANPTPPGSTSAAATTPGARPSTGATSAGASSPAGHRGSNAAVPPATSPRATHSSAKATPSASTSGSPSATPSGSPSGTPSTTPSGSPSVTPSPTGTACIAGICL
jgi:eukaryotic-like serine/threonine-protein kinase